jgi:ribosome-binding factor A
MSERLDKFNSVVVTEAGTALAELALPGTLATVTAAETSPDLSEATVWISVLPASPEVWQQVEDHRPVIQAHLAKRLQAKRTPRITLREDHGQAHANKIERLLS